MKLKVPHCASLLSLGAAYVICFCFVRCLSQMYLQNRHYQVKEYKRSFNKKILIPVFSQVLQKLSLQLVSSLSPDYEAANRDSRKGEQNSPRYLTQSRGYSISYLTFLVSMTSTILPFQSDASSFLPKE